MPVASLVSVFRLAGSNTGCSNWSSWMGATRRTAVFSSISFSATMSTATRTAAGPVRLPLRVCSM